MPGLPRVRTILDRSVQGLHPKSPGNPSPLRLGVRCQSVLQPSSTFGTRKPLAPKHKIVEFYISIYICKKNLKKVATCHSNKTGINNIQDTHKQISKFTSSRIRSRGLSPPLPTLEKTVLTPFSLLPVWFRGVGMTRKEARSLFQALPNLQTLLSSGPLKGWGSA